MASASRLPRHPRAIEEKRDGTWRKIPLRTLTPSTGNATRRRIVKILSISKAEWAFQGLSNPELSSAAWWAHQGRFAFPSLAHLQLLFLIRG